MRQHRNTPGKPDSELDTGPQDHNAPGGQQHLKSLVLREQAGVRRHLIQRPVDDANFVVIDLEFDTTAEAEKFLAILKTSVWSSRESSPGLAGAPETKILYTADLG